MVFSDNTTKLGLIQRFEKLIGADYADVSGTSNRLYEATGLLNEGYGIVADIIMKADGRMKWDDPNHTNLPTASTSLVSGQEQYAVFSLAPSALQDWLTIERVEILDSNDKGILLTPLDRRLVGDDYDEFNETDGIPLYYDFKGDSIYLKPAPNYSKALGLTVYFEREPSYFASTDTTKRPGIATKFHIYLPLYAAQIWCEQNGLYDKADRYAKQLKELEFRITEFYKTRAKFENPVISRQYVKYA